MTAIPAAPGGVMVEPVPGTRVPMPVVESATGPIKAAGRGFWAAFMTLLASMFTATVTTAAVVIIALAGIGGVMVWKQENRTHEARLTALVSENKTLKVDLAFERGRPWWKLVFSRSWW
jgi:uncharacterized protein HemX